jgi:hypothetical protein
MTLIGCMVWLVIVVVNVYVLVSLAMGEVNGTSFNVLCCRHGSCAVCNDPLKNSAQ